MRNLLIAMPTQGQVATPTATMLLGLRDWLGRRGVRHAVTTYDFSDIVVSRNQLMSQFLSDRSFTDVLLLDSDIVVAPEAVLRLLLFDAPFTAVAYAKKQPRWQDFREQVEADMAATGGTTDTATLLSRSWDYVVQRNVGGARHRPAVDGDFITVPAVGMGVVCLDRSVPERMVEVGAARPRRDMGCLPLHAAVDFHDFFSHRTSSDGGIMYGEDQSFCHRWVTDCGGEIWVDTRTSVTHVGTGRWTGTYAERAPLDFPSLSDG